MYSWENGTSSQNFALKQVKTRSRRVMATATETQTMSTTQVPVRFTTQTRYALPSQRFMVPANWRRLELSQLVNKALELPSPIPFDFLAHGTLLRSSLSDWLEKSGVGTVSSALVMAFQKG